MTRSTADESFGDDLTIVHVITRLAYGGSEQRLIDAINAVPGARVTVVTGDVTGADRLGAIRARRPEIRHLTSLCRAPNPSDDMRAFKGVRDAVKDIRPDIIHTHQAKAGALGRLAAFGSGAAVVHSSSMATFGEGYGKLESTLFRQIELFSAPQVKRYAVVGHDLLTRLVAAGLSPQKMTVVRSALQLDPFLRAREHRGRIVRSSSEINILYVGSLERRKGVERLPEFASELSRVTQQPVNLRVAGAGSQREQDSILSTLLESTVSIDLLGYRSDIAALMSTSDLVVLLSSSEGLPQVLVQAAAAGVPFAAFAVDGVQELLDMGASGVQAPLGDVAQLAAKAATMINSETGMMPTDRFAQWKSDRIADLYRSIYGDVVTGGPRT